MLVQVLAVAALVLLLWSVFRFAMGLRAAKALREGERREHEARGRRVVAELPLPERVVLFLEGSEGFYWAGREVRKHALRGARLLLNEAVVASWSRAGADLPEAPAPRPEEYDGREHWSVRLYLEDDSTAEVPCGRVREGISREAAQQVFDAVRRSAAPTP